MARILQDKEYPFELTVTDPDTGGATVIQGVTKGFRKDSVFDSTDYEYGGRPAGGLNHLLYTDISLRATGGYIERLRRPYGGADE